VYLCIEGPTHVPERYLYQEVQEVSCTTPVRVLDLLLNPSAVPEQGRTSLFLYLFTHFFNPFYS